MKVNKIVVFLVLFLPFSIVAQDFKFGKVSKEELEEQFYPLDSTENGAYLYKYRRSYFKYIPGDGFMLVTDVVERIKIYNKKGFSLANKLITVYTPEIGVDEKVSNIKGFTFILENDKIVKEKLAKEAIFKTKVNTNFSQVKITLPKIKEGCVLDLKYSIYSPYAQYIDEVRFQAGVPIKTLKNKIEIPEYFVYKQQTKGYFHIPMEQTSKPTSIGDLRFQLDVFNFNGVNIPSLRDDEPYVSSINNYRGGVKFELKRVNFTSIGGDFKNYSSTWNNVATSIYNAPNFGAELTKKNYYKNDLQAILNQSKTEYQKIEAIFQFVKSKVRWNGSYGYGTQNGVRNAYKNSSGNVAEINLMLTSMLRFAGLDANPVLVSSKDNGVPYFPSMLGFNYVISAVTFSDGTYVLLDASDVFSEPNLLPSRAVNWQGRVIRENGSSSWVNLSNSKYAQKENIVMIKIDENNIVQGTFRSKFSNLTALEYRNTNNHIKEDDVVANLEEKYNLEIDDFKVTNDQILGKPILRTIKFSSEDLIEKINNKIYVNPILFLAEKENPFKLKERKFPVDFDNKWKVDNKVFITIPNGYIVKSLPESLAIGLPENLGFFRYKLMQKANKINVLTSLQINRSKIAPSYYEALTNFYAQVIQKQTEKIVFIKQ